jgi:hypothetical protein
LVHALGLKQFAWVVTVQVPSEAQQAPVDGQFVQLVLPGPYHTPLMVLHAA